MPPCAAGPAAVPFSEPQTLAVGMRVMLHSLKKESMNGKLGVIVSYECES